MTNPESINETLTSSSSQVVEPTEKDPNTPLVRPWKRFIGRCALALCLATGLTAVDSAPATAETGGYPNADAMELDAANYEWWVDENNNGQYNTGELFSPRGYAYRNCTDWVAWRAPQLSGVNVPWGWGNAKNWNDAAISVGYAVDNIPEKGDIAVWEDGDYGHVAVVESVNPLTVSEYNGVYRGSYGIKANPSGIDHFIDMNGTDSSVGGNGNGGGSNGIDTIGVYNPNIATFDLRNSNTTGIHDVTLAYGNIGAVALTGDWNGDGIDTIGVYNPSLATFDLRNSNTTGNHDITLAYGNIGAKPLVGDWNGDGIDTIGVYNPTLGTFDLRNSNTTGNHDITLAYGNIGAIPLVGDWNGDGIDTIGVYNPSLATFDLRNSNTTGIHDITLAYGNIGAIPVVGDWNGDGIDTIGVYNPTLGTFDLRNSNTTGNHDITLAYGNIGAKPIIGDWNGQ